jgi:hypothetical protein
MQKSRDEVRVVDDAVRPIAEELGLRLEQWQIYEAHHEEGTHLFVKDEQSSPATRP